MRVNPPREQGAGILAETLRVSALPRPGAYLHLTDTTSRGRGGVEGGQYFYFRTFMENQVHCRHGRRANGWFMDGHAEGMDRKRLEDLGVTPLVGKDDVPGYFE